MRDGFVASIRSRGFWRLNLRPKKPVEDELSLGACRRLVTQSAVSLRGWDYPHIPHREGDDTGTELHENFVQAWTDWNVHREFWRMYTSGQFLHYRALREDWRELDQWGGPPPSSWGSPIEGRVLGVIDNLWSATEMFEFTSRLTQAEPIYQDGVELTLTLHSGDESRQLWIDERHRAPFDYARSTNAREIRYGVEFVPGQHDDPRQLAETASRYFFERFGWEPVGDQLQTAIARLYEG